MGTPIYTKHMFPFESELVSCELGRSGQIRKKQGVRFHRNISIGLLASTRNLALRIYFSVDSGVPRFAAQLIQNLYNDGISYQEIGVLFRTQVMSRCIEQECSSLGIPFSSPQGCCSIPHSDSYDNIQVMK